MSWILCFTQKYILGLNQIIIHVIEIKDLYIQLNGCRKCLIFMISTITSKFYIHDCKMKTNWNFANLVLGGLVNCNNKKHENHHQTLIIRLLNWVKVFSKPHHHRSAFHVIFLELLCPLLWLVCSWSCCQCPHFVRASCLSFLISSILIHKLLHSFIIYE